MCTFFEALQCGVNSNQFFLPTETQEASHPRVFCKKGTRKNFARFKGKHLCQSLFFKVVASLKLWHRYFPVNFAKFLRTLIFNRTTPVAASEMLYERGLKTNGFHQSPKQSENMKIRLKAN